MTQARCGSTDPIHVARRCKGCKAVYNKRWAEGNPIPIRLVRNPAECVFCGLCANNSAGFKVLRYPLLRHWDKGGRHTSFCVGSMAICDRCVMEYGKIKPEFQPPNVNRQDDGLRSHDGLPTTLAIGG